MRKYRTVMSGTLGSCLTNLVYTALLIRSTAKLQTSVCSQILQEYTYMAVFSFFLFYQMSSEMPMMTVIYRFESIRQYYRHRLACAVKRLMTMTVYVTLFQTVLFGICDPLFEIRTLLYRNTCLLLFAADTACLILLYGNFRRITAGYILWNLLYILQILVPSALNPFSLLQKEQPLRFLCCITAFTVFTCIYTEIMMGCERRRHQWLESAGKDLV